MTAWCLGVLLVSGTSIAAITVWRLGQQVSDNAVDIGGASDAPQAVNVGDYEGAFNVLIVGADNSSTQGVGYGQRDATLNDVNLLVHVAADHRSGVAISFPRDLVTPHPACTGPDGTTYPPLSSESLNAAIARGGLACVVDTVRNVTDLDIDYAMEVSFDSVIQMTNAIGGVSVCLDAPLRDPYVYDEATGAVLDLPAGIQELSGFKALGFLRSRHGVGDGSDLGRISSQQQYLSSLVRKIKSDDTLTNLPRLYSLANVVTKNVHLSDNITPTTMIALARTLRSIDLDNLVFVQYPVGEDPYNPAKVVPDPGKADELINLVRTDQPFELGNDSTGVGVDSTATPTATGPIEGGPAAPSPTPSTTNVSPITPDPVTLDGVPGQTAQDETCAAVN